MTLVKSLYSGDPDVILLFVREYADLQVPDVNIQGGRTYKCYSDNILVQLMCVQFCLCNTCTGGAMSWAHMLMFPIAINKLFK